MTRPQASTAFIPIRNHSGGSPRPVYASPFTPESEAAGKDSWYSITAKKTGSGNTTAEVMIYDEIGVWGISAKEFVKEITALEADQMNVHINSPGGDVFDGVAIYNALRMHSSKVTVYIDSLAASAASFIAQAGDEVVMLRNAEMMIHDASAFAWGNEETMLETASLLARISNNIADIYAQRAGGTIASWRGVMQAEMWYTADEAVKAGLADSVLNTDDEGADEAKDAWDLKVFNYAGRSAAPSPIEEMRKIINRVQEAPVAQKATPRAEGEKTDPPATEAPPAAPEAPATEPVVPAPAADPQEEGEPPAEQPPTPPPTTPTNPPAARVGSGFVVNGLPVTDLQAVQAHINALEGFQRDTRDANRKAFINGLASGDRPKIVAPQIEAIEKLVASMSDEQYEMWSASWEAAPAVALLGSHGGEGGGTPSGTSATTAADRLEILKDIVAMHKRGGMKKEQIEATDSYKELVKLQPDFTL